MEKKVSRLRRAKKIRCKIRELRMPRLTVHKTPRHIYAQLIDAKGEKTVVAMSTLDKEFTASSQYSGNVEAAKVVGKIIAERALKAGIKQVAFDRSGFHYHGRVKALADAARDGGLEF